MLVNVDGQRVPLPINLDTINQLCGLRLTSFEMETWLESVAEKKAEINNSEDVIVNKVGRELSNKFFRGCTRKHGGRILPSSMPA